MDITGETFRGTKVRLNGQKFFDCHFDDVVFLFNGTRASFVECAFEGRLGFYFDGEFNAALHFLREWHQGFGPDGVETIVEVLADIMRAAPPKQTLTIE